MSQPCHSEKGGDPIDKLKIVQPKVEEVPATQTRTTCPTGYMLGHEIPPYSDGRFYISRADENANTVIDGKHYAKEFQYPAPAYVCIPNNDQSSSTD